MTIRAHFPGNGFMNRADLVFEAIPLAVALDVAAFLYPNATMIEVLT